MMGSEAHTAIVLCDGSYTAPTLGLSFTCQKDAGHEDPCGPVESTGEIDGNPPEEGAA